MPKKRKNDADQSLAKAFSHPLRVRILGLLKDGVASPNLLSKELGENLNLVAYHVRVLEKYGCVELVDTKPRRGATEHFYRAAQNKLFSDNEWTRLAQLQDRHVSRKTLTVDQQGWDEVAELLDTTLEQLAKIEAKAARRLADGAEGRVAARVEILQAKSSDEV